MPTQKEILDATAARITTLVAPNSVVVPRNILAVKNSNWLGLLRSTAYSNKIRGWMVTPQSLSLIEQRQGGARYLLTIGAWQFLEYWTGNNSDNSEDVFNNERDAVINGFAVELPPPLQDARPMVFSLIDLFQIQIDSLIHIAQGSIEVEFVTPC